MMREREKNKDESEIITIYVGNLKFTKKEGEIRKMFQKFGKVIFVKNILDERTGNGKGFSFVKMTNREDALDAINNLNGKQVDDRTLKVSIALEVEERSAPKKAKSFKKEKEAIEELPTKAPRKKQKKGLALLFDYLNK
jgi:RNA recognition motif-containing protein